MLYYHKYITNRYKHFDALLYIMFELSSTQTAKLSDNIPKFELSYETISHTKVSSSYNLVTAIPTGKKVMIWFTYYNTKQVCYLFELNKEKRITKGRILDVKYEDKLALGTILYGSSIMNENNEIVSIAIDDIVYYHGISLNNTNVIHKLSMIHKTFAGILNQDKIIKLYSCAFWQINLDDTVLEYPTTISNEIFSTIPYNIHHIQYRSTYEKRPYINVFMNRKLNVVSLPSQPKIINSFSFTDMPFKMSLHKAQYKYTAIFQIRADIQYDIYHLFACGRNNQKVYYNVAYIPNYKTSTFMNSLFRKIRENDNLDYIEESDDEDDFQNMDEDKYVDMNKTLFMECTFHKKFKRWVPNKVVSRTEKITHISQL